MDKYMTTSDKKNYTLWHDKAYKEDRELANYVKIKNQRWAIIMSYYAMHNVTKLLLAQYNIFLKEHNIHQQCIDELEKLCLKNKTEFEFIFQSLKNAKEKYEFYINKAKELPLELTMAKRERNKANYYSEKILSQTEEFLEKVTKPYITTVEELIKNAR